MKNIFKSTMLLMGTVALLAACETDRDSNPTIQQPTTFVLNTPAYANAGIDLEHSQTLRFTCSQPDYGYTAAVTYNMQVSLTDSYTLSSDDADEDQTPDYVQLDESYTSCTIDADATLFSKAVMQLGQWADGSVPSTVSVYARLTAAVGDYAISSNSVTLNVIPYYIELKDALPQLWYITGNGGVGNWDNSANKEGYNTIPLSLVKGATYDAKTGEGDFTYTGYFINDQFKLVLTPGAWEPMWGVESETAEDQNGTPQYRGIGGDDPACWKPSKAGYYTITFSSTGGTSNTSIKLTTYTGETPEEFTGWELVGDFCGWPEDSTGAISLTQNTFNPHIWWADATIATDGGAKFRLPASWSDECGGDLFPYGVKTGNNIPVKAGTYRIVFNDIDRSYFFFER
jgi:hypothetical protein